MKRITSVPRTIFAGAGLVLGAMTALAAPALYAHEGHAHKMMGTVKAVHADMNHVEITVKGGKTEGFQVNADTKYLKGSTALTLSDLKAGMRVVVDTKMDGDKAIATQVRIGATTAATKVPSPPAAHKH